MVVNKATLTYDLSFLLSVFHVNTKKTYIPLYHMVAFELIVTCIINIIPIGSNSINKCSLKQH